MNLRQAWVEIFQKPTGRLALFLLVGGLVIAFLLMRRGSNPGPDNTKVSPTAPATQATAYSFEENIPAPPSARATPSKPIADQREARPTPTPKPPPPIPQTIFATVESTISEFYLPYGRLIQCELVNTIDSSSIETPIIGLVIADVWHGGRLIVPAGAEVHGSAQQVAARERLGSQRQWIVVFQDGRELPVTGMALNNAPDVDGSGMWSETDGAAGLQGFTIQSDNYAEAKAILATMISAAAGAFPDTTNIVSPFGGVTQVQDGGLSDAFSAGIQAGGQIYSERLLRNLDANPFFVRIPAGTLFYLYVMQTVDLAEATIGNSKAREIPQSDSPISGKP